MDERASPPRVLPRPLTSFIGRKHTVATIVDRLRDEEIRLLTLTGPGGVGKTRVAIRVAEAIAHDDQGGVWFVSLAAVRDPALVASTIGRTLGVDDTAARPVADGIVARLVDRPGLLILDNFEHVLSAGPLVTDLLSACPGVKVLVTSRAVLRLSGEHVIAVPTLATVDPERWPLPAQLREMEAVRLFAERAAAVNAAFVLTESNIVEVAGLCARLDGLPLAIELAAARTRALSPRSMLQRLDQQLHLLTDGARDQPVRLRSLRDAIAWSYDLLLPREQELFGRLGIFVGGFTLAAATAVAGVQGSQDYTVVEGVAALLAQSLLQLMDSPADEPRYHMLETVRHFALERLTASGESHVVGERHAAYFLSLVDRLAPVAFPFFSWGRDTPSAAQPLDARAANARVEPEQHNVRAALDWLVQHGQSEESLQLAAAGATFFQSWGQLPEAQMWLDRALATAASEATSIKAQALLRASIVAFDLGNLEGADRRAREALSIWRGLDDFPGQAAALQALALVEEHHLNFETATELFEASLEMWRELDEPIRVGTILSLLGGIAYAQGQHDRALALETEALKLLRAAGDLSWVSKTEWYLGLLAASRGEILDAARHHRSSLIGLAAIDDTWMLFKPLVGLAALAAQCECFESSARLLGAVDHMLHQVGGQLLPFDRPAYEQAERAASAALGEERFSTVRDAGSRLTLENLLAEANAVVAAAEDAARKPRRRGAAPSSTLTSREREVLRLVAEGKTDRQIGEILFVSRRTVNSHIANILGQFGVHSRQAAVERARERGLLPSEANARRYT